MSWYSNLFGWGDVPDARGDRGSTPLFGAMVFCLGFQKNHPAVQGTLAAFGGKEVREICGATHCIVPDDLNDTDPAVQSLLACCEAEGVPVVSVQWLQEVA